MAKRIFSLPRREQLTKEQRRVLRLPADGQHLIVGAPGTGKSVVALWRFKELYENDISNLYFLTFNHVLSHANKNLVSSDLSDNMDTSLSWLYKLHYHKIGWLSAKSDSHHPDYEMLLNNPAFNELDYSHISFIIDEGQDLPSGWYDCVVELGIENFFIVADQNQQITEECSSRKELQECLGLDTEDVIELTENWRNSTPIALLAGYFYTDATSPKPRLPNRISADIPILYTYDNIAKIKEQILSQYDRDPSQLIGLIVANDNKREYWYKWLQNDSQQRDNPPPIVSTYYSTLKDNINIDFSNGGIVVLNDKSVKGIEFDVVFIIIDGLGGQDTELLKKRLYVMTSRAIKRLYLFQSNIQPNRDIEAILPKAGETEIIEVNGQQREVEILKRITL